MPISRVRRQLRVIVESTRTRGGRVFDLVVQTMIVVSMASFAIETLPGLSPEWRRALSGFEGFSILFFACEYALRLWVAKKPSRYAFSFFGVVDLVAIVPALLGGAIDARSLRSLRLLRLIRLLKLARYNAAVRRLHHALLLAKEELVLFGAVSLVLLFIAAAGVYQFEH